MEAIFIKEYYTFGLYGYNETSGGIGVTMTDVIRNKISNANLDSKVHLIHLQNILVYSIIKTTLCMNVMVILIK